jgi:hypothetical protein
MLIWINVYNLTMIDKATVNQTTERAMTTGNLLYLLMVIGVFLLFSVVLAYQSWQQSRLGPDTVSKINRHPPLTHALTA